MKFGVCSMIKNENLYLREWVEHYIKLGFDKIILYDNNEINGEVPNVVIQDYIDNGVVDIINRRQSALPAREWVYFQINAFNECIEQYKNELDWIAFLDIDEFLELKQYKKVQYLFEHMPYNKFDAIIMSWYSVGNKNELYYKNKNVQERFSDHLTGPYDMAENIDTYVKSFVNTSVCPKFEDHIHCPKSENVCNEYGVLCTGTDAIMMLNYPNHEIMYIKHYYTKSLIEFLYRSINNCTLTRNIYNYKNINGWSEEHEKVYQKFLKDNNVKAS